MNPSSDKPATTRRGLSSSRRSSFLHRHALLAGSLLGVLGLAIAPAASADDADFAVPDDLLVLEAYEVSGEKLGRTTQETTISVATFGSSDLAGSTDIDLADTLARAGNVFVTSQGFTIRGIPNSGFTYSEGSDMASVLVDGSIVDSQMFGFDGVSLWDLDKVEILRGPQSTTQGRNSMAGAVIARTRAPTFTWDAAARASYGELESRQLAFALGGPIHADWLAFRIALDDRYSDGGITNITRGEDDWDRTDTRTWRGKLLLKPTRWNGFSALATYAHTESHSGERAYAYGATLDELYQRLAYENTRNDFSSRSRLGSLEINQDFRNGWKLTAISSWSDFWSTSAYDGDRTAEADLVYGYGYDNDALTQEVRLLAIGETWRLVSGVYLADSTRGVSSDGQFLYTVPSPIDQVFGLPSGATALLSVQYQSQIDTFNKALFFNGEWQPIEPLSLTLGARLDHEKVERDSTQEIVLLRGFPDARALVDVPSLGIPAGTPADVVLQALTADASAAGDGSDDFGNILPTAGATWHWSPTLSTGLSYTRGYRSGGVTLNQKRAEIVPFDPEYTDNFELALRSSWLDGRVTLNGNIFLVRWTDQQVEVQLSDDRYDRQVDNAGRSTYYGAEIELRENLATGWTAYQSLGYTHSRFDDFTTAAGDYAGNSFPNAPRWTASAGLAYDRREGPFGHLDVNYASRAYSDAGNTFELPARLLVNARIGYRSGRWSAFVFARNLLDEDYLENRWRQDAQLYGANVGTPRVLGIGAEFRL
ncbi:MAG: TonB-dependent receptor [Bacteroidetes bacterium]|nr:MAG: TonB-dependent receptor [Bacteroidota bacterium]